MMMFVILFSYNTPINIMNFPGALVTVLVMMLGEINYADLYFPSDLVLNVTDGEINEKQAFTNFPFTGHLTIILFILVFCLVIMNLLVGIAVSDINHLMKSGKRNQLLAQVELISSVENFKNTKLFRVLPDCIQSKVLG